MYNQDRLAQILSNTSAITDLLDTYDFEGTDYPMITFDSKVPKDWGVTSTSINYYLMMQLNQEYQDARYTVACRANSYYESFNLACTVKTELHRHITDVAFYATQLQTVPPANDYDNYLTPVEIKLLGR